MPWKCVRFGWTCATDLGVDPQFLIDVNRTMLDRLPDAVRTAVTELPTPSAAGGLAMAGRLVVRLAGLYAA